MERLRQWPWWSVPVLVFLGTRIPSALMLAWIGRDQPLQRRPGEDRAHSGYWRMLANWDGGWYRRIVLDGYPSHLPVHHGAVEQNTWAFYPLYPATVRLVTATGLSFEVAASLVSLTCGTAAMCLLYRMLTPTCGRFAATLTVLALCTYPAAVTFQAAYTESMALLLVLAALWALRSRRYGATLGFALLLSVTRPIVLPLALVVGIHGVVRWRRRDVEAFPRRDLVRCAVVAVGTALSFAIWPVVAGVVTGRADAYAATQNAWSKPGSEGWPTWVAMFIGGDYGFVLRLLVVLGGAALAWVVLRRPAALWGTELRSWAWAYPLFLLGSTRPTSSIFRYAMLAAVPFWPFPEAGGTVARPRERWALAGSVALFGLLGQYVWLTWFFVVGPASLGYP